MNCRLTIGYLGVKPVTSDVYKWDPHDHEKKMSENVISDDDEGPHTTRPKVFLRDCYQEDNEEATSCFVPVGTKITQRIKLFRIASWKKLLSKYNYLMINTLLHDHSSLPALKREINIL